MLTNSFAGETETPQYRDYSNAPARIKTFYKEQHTYQTFDFVKNQKDQLYAIIQEIASAKNLTDLQKLEREGKVRLMTIWQALHELDTLIDESDPDTSLPNSEHAFQTAEAIRMQIGDDTKQDWFVLLGLLHDIGKVDALLRKNLPQWAAVGDTFPVGCAYSRKNIFYDYFLENPDFNNVKYSSELGIYPRSTGLNNIHMAYGHDEYAYAVLAVQGKMPAEALMTIRFHSFYPLHHENEYGYLLKDRDRMFVDYLKKFQKFDLYSKTETKVSREAREKYYKELINKYFPPSEGMGTETERILAWPILKDVWVEGGSLHY